MTIRKALLLAAVSMIQALPASAAQPSNAAPAQQTSMVQDQALAGAWSGIMETVAPHFRRRQPVHFELEQDKNGWKLVYHDRSRPATIALQVRGDTFVGRSTDELGTPTTIQGRLARDRRSLDVTITGGTTTGSGPRTVRLSRGLIPIRSYSAPMVGHAGARVTQYRYRQPMRAKDGIVTSTPEAEDLDPAPLRGLVQHVMNESGAADRQQTEGVLIFRNNKLVLEEYFWGMTADNPHEISSCTKSVTSILAGIAADAGQISLDQRVTSYFANRKDTLWVRDKVPITVRDILAMSSGTIFDNDAAASSSVALVRSKNLVSFALSQKPVHTAGAVYNYDNSLPTLMGPLIASATGQTIEAFAEDRLFKPLGIRNYSWLMMPEGIPLAAGGMLLRGRDMGKIGLTMLNGGVWNGTRILSENYVRAATRQQTAPGQYAYGFYWHLISRNGQHAGGLEGYAAMGQGGQLIVVFPEQKMVVVVLSANWAGSSTSREAGVPFPFDLISDYVEPSLKRPMSRR